LSSKIKLFNKLRKKPEYIIGKKMEPTNPVNSNFKEQDKGTIERVCYYNKLKLFSRLTLA
jgi:hypothetical protein